MTYTVWVGRTRVSSGRDTFTSEADAVAWVHQAAASRRAALGSSPRTYTVVQGASAVQHLTV